VITPALRVLVVEDDPDVAALTATILERRVGCRVIVLPDAVRLVPTLAAFDPDVVVTDIQLPGTDGLEVARVVRERAPATAVIVMTAHASVEHAVGALRSRADEFLAKPVPSAQLTEVVLRLGTRGRQERERRSSTVVLAIGAHPDDVEIGVGGTLAAHAAAGDDLVVLTLSRGARGGDTDVRQLEALAAAEVLRARLFLEDLPDTQVSHAEPTVGIIERVVAEVRPSVVYTHTRHDRHQDHRAVHDAVVVATRTVPTVACFQSPSSTVDFRPHRFVDVAEHLDTKLAALRCYASQTAIRDYLDPIAIRAAARYWSRFAFGTAVEPLELVRDSGGIVSRVREERAASAAERARTTGPGHPGEQRPGAE